MDFGALLHVAKKNETAKKEVRTYNTKFAPPKKDKKEKALSVNIQKFLARKEAEEKKKNIQDLKKRDDLLALRSKDKKATRRVNVMLKRTKSANQSVIDDAVDNDNTAVTLAGPAQPDEDDYGYVSQEASAFYNKMMEKYSKLPEEQKFPNAKKKASSNLTCTKDRVKAALEKEKLDAMLPHRRKRKHKDGEEQQDEHSENHSDEDSGNDDKSMPPPKAKPKIKAPPPINFTELLKLAAQKQHEPIMVEVKPKDEGPLFTKKQKFEFEKEQQRRVGNEKGKLSIEQINEIRKLPPSHLYRTKKREISRAEIYENEDDDDDSERVNNNRIPKVTGEHSMYKKEDHNENNINKKEGLNDRFTNNGSRREVPYDRNMNNNNKKEVAHDRTNNMNKREVPHDRVATNTNKKELKDTTDNRASKNHNGTVPSDSRMSKTYAERSSTDGRNLKGVSGDSKLNDNYPTGSKMSKMQYDPQSSKMSSFKPPSDNRPKSSTVRPQNSDNRIPKSSDRIVNDNRVSTSYKNSPPSDNRIKTNNTQLMSKSKPNIPQKQEYKFKEPSTSKPQMKNNNLTGRTAVNQGKYLDSNKNSKLGNKEFLQKQLPLDDRKQKQIPPKDFKERQFLPGDLRRKEIPQNMKPKQFPPPDVRRNPPPDVRRNPPPDVRRNPPQDVRRREFPSRDNKSKLQIGNKRRIIDDDDDEEYDSEMDDFIDDGPEESNDYSSHIREIFGYDKRKYKKINDEEDLDDMESSFAQQMQEDIRSTKLGLMEDLEDIKREKEEKRIKALKKKGRL